MGLKKSNSSGPKKIKRGISGDFEGKILMSIRDTSNETGRKLIQKHAHVFLQRFPI